MTHLRLSTAIRERLKDTWSFALGSNIPVANFPQYQRLRL